MPSTGACVWRRIGCRPPIRMHCGVLCVDTSRSNWMGASRITTSVTPIGLRRAVRCVAPRSNVCQRDSFPSDRARKLHPIPNGRHLEDRGSDAEGVSENSVAETLNFNGAAVGSRVGDDDYPAQCVRSRTCPIFSRSLSAVAETHVRAAVGDPRVARTGGPRQ